ncbi:flavin-containing monooxygenase [Mycolicibacterium pulveris]|uniref:flavin-containing monooxygenase n=1 Tax=Mycolicibacterium pulveris TaxID=36813 RepID=UPI003CE68D8D
MVDPQELARKYAQEREKRIRADGAGQYIPVEIGSEVEADPFTKTQPREPITKDTEVAVIGAGFAGLLSAVHLRKEGVDDITVIDKAADFGGTWYWNRYPGIACDTDSYLYLPLLEETGYIPAMKYSPGDEIFDYAKAIAKQYNCYEGAVFQARVRNVAWDDNGFRWTVTTDRGDEIRARYVVLATGGILHRPKLPGIPGLETFKGHWFHSSRWDFDVTGGDSRGNLHKLADKRVAIVGTGPTALQAFPHVAKSAKETYLVQRTPTIVLPRDNGPTDEEWFVSQEPGWQEKRWANFEAQMLGIPVEEKIVEDEWTRVWSIPPLETPEDGSEPDMDAYLRMVEDNDIAQMERARARIEEVVDDPELAEALKPWYATHCKRPGFNDEYLQAFNRPNVHLLDTDGKGADAITENGIVVGGKEYEVDVIVYATGFEAVVTPDRSGGFDVIGCHGRTLAEAWQQRVRTVHGIQTHGFPNMYIVGGLRQTAVTVNNTYAFNYQARHVASYIAALREQDVAKIDITESAVQEWCDVMDEKVGLVFNAEAVQACTPGYFNNEGDFDAATGNFEHGRPIWVDAYGGGTFEYQEILSKWVQSRAYETRATIVRADKSDER